MNEDEIRQRFESLISSEPYALPVFRFEDDARHSWPGQYMNYKVELAWCVWQEAWQQAIGVQSVESENEKS